MSEVKKHDRLEASATLGTTPAHEVHADNLAEIEILSSIINDPHGKTYEVVETALGDRGEEVFADVRNREIYRAISHYYDRGQVPTPASICHALKGAAGLFDGETDRYVDNVILTPMAPTEHAVNSTTRVLVEESILREASRETTRLANDVSGGKIDQEQIFGRLKRIEDTLELHSVSSEVGDVARRVFANATPTWYLPTGISKVDEVLGGRGLAAGMLTVCAARAKVGKTIFMNNLLVEVIKQGSVPIVLNLETREVEFLAKIMSRMIIDDDIRDIIQRDLMITESDNGIDVDDQDFKGVKASKEDIAEFADYRQKLWDIWSSYDWSRLRNDSILSELGWGSLTRFISGDEETVNNMPQQDRDLIWLVQEWIKEQKWEVHSDRSITLQGLTAIIQGVKIRESKKYDAAVKEWHEELKEFIDYRVEERGDERADDELEVAFENITPKPQTPRIVLMIDYLQLMVKDSRFEREELTQLTKGLKGLAIDESLSVFVLAQLNRQAEGEVPRASDLRGSGSIEQDADTVIALYHPIQEPDDQSIGSPSDQTMVTIPVARHSEGGDFRLIKKASHQLFTLSDEEPMGIDFEDEFTETVLDTPTRSWSGSIKKSRSR
ncbi:DnaB-like helicase C-terminal domain-containing protein [Corynebacterium casei]|uniref:DnaB-like helicase C-terminal domain-containing protein n=1 Tax=Corynebacterium casei TaxID=160386 RepID=UPI003FD14E1F